MDMGTNKNKRTNTNILNRKEETDRLRKVNSKAKYQKN